MKTCSKCRESKPPHQFAKGGAKHLDGLYPWCRACKSVADREYRERRKATGWKRVLSPEQVEKNRARAAAWAKANPKRVVEQVKLYRERHPEKPKAWAREKAKRDGPRTDGSYLRTILAGGFGEGVSTSDIPDALVALHLASLQLKRLVRQQRKQP